MLGMFSSGWRNGAGYFYPAGRCPTALCRWRAAGNDVPPYVGQLTIHLLCGGFELFCRFWDTALPFFFGRWGLARSRTLRVLRRRGLEPPTASKVVHGQWIEAQVAAARADLVEQPRLMRDARVNRWKATITTLWANRSVRLYSWLKVDTPA